MVMYTRVKDSNVRGETAKKNVLREKPRVTIMAPNRYSLKKACGTMETYLKMKHTNNNGGIDWDVLFADEDENCPIMDSRH